MVWLLCEKMQLCISFEIFARRWPKTGAKRIGIRPPILDPGFFAKAARGHALQGAQALILMGDWCAAAQPMFENQVCGELADREDRFGGQGIRRWS